MLYDLAIIGGGINGCGCAAEAAMRGLSILLCEQDDLASKTSSSSSKLIHGGLRYLEHHDISLVKKALDEQQILIEIAPHLVHPLPFVLPHDEKGRPMWLLRMGLFLYDHLSLKNTLPNSQYVDRAHQAPLFNPLVSSLREGFVFYDCQTDDARLTIVNALLAKQHGADIRTQTSLMHAEVVDGLWQLTLRSHDGTPFQIHAKALINAAGPWVASVSERLNVPLKHGLSLVKGSHIVVHRLYEGEHAYLLQHEDKRVIFVIPYQGATMIGTTDVPQTGSLDEIAIEPAEVDYFLDIIQHYFRKRLSKADIIHTWSGVRPLVFEDSKEPAALSRDYLFDYQGSPAPMVTIYSGKITTYRQLASQVIEQFRPIFSRLEPSFSQTTPLPGATYQQMNFKAYRAFAEEQYAWLETDILEHYLTTYGTLTEHILKDCTKPADLGQSFTPILYEVEVRYLMNEEWARHADDILWRRTKLGLCISQEDYQTLNQFCHDVTSTMS